MKTDVIINRDALYALRELPSESVNCCVTSPPYYGLALESISIFLCVVIQNTGIVTGICCLYVFSGASVYLMLWSDMETVSIPLKFFVYGNPMYYWMNFSSCRTMGIIEHLPFYFIGCISLLIVGGLIMIRKEIK